MLWKIGDDMRVVALQETALAEEQLLEANLENWVSSHPELLGEPLLIIGRQVLIPEVNDRIDLLALDPAGNVVIIELKRGALGDGVDTQALRYASYVSRWSYAQIEAQAIKHCARADAPAPTLAELFADFCAEAGVDPGEEDYNRDQRIIIAGRSVREKLGSVALWLRMHRVDVKVVELTLFRDGTALLLQPTIIIPPPTTERYELGAGAPQGDEPWLADGQSWHLERRCGADTAALLRELIKVVQEAVPAEGPFWNQKQYVALRKAGMNWMAITTRRSMLLMRFKVKKDSMKVDDIAEKLGVAVFNKEADLAEKLEMPSSVVMRELAGHTRIGLRLKPDFDLQGRSAALRDLVQSAWETNIG